MIDIMGHFVCLGKNAFCPIYVILRYLLLKTENETQLSSQSSLRPLLKTDKTC